MQTNFTLAQLADNAMAESESILRTCVHCGFCLATCPTYTLLGDELDSPRGRIYQIKQMFETGRPAPASTVTHIDRCLSCLSCMTTCPSGVHYMHLVDHARTYIGKTYARPLLDRAMRALLSFVLPRPGLFRLALIGAALARPVAQLVPRRLLSARLAAMLDLVPKTIPSPSPMDRPHCFPAQDSPTQDFPTQDSSTQDFPTKGTRRARVALLTGCAQKVIDPSINEATIRLLTRHGVEVVVAEGAGCCGALTHHMGREQQALASARGNVAAWWRETEQAGGAGLDAVIVNTSGCGTTVKDYGFMLREEPDWAEKAAQIAGLTQDITEFMAKIGLLQPHSVPSYRVAYHSACSMQHGQKITTLPKDLLRAAGHEVLEVPEGHLCCGSAGTYNLLQPEIAGKLKDRKVANIERTQPDIIATGNIGCMSQIGSGTDIPIVHTVALLDWSTGGPRPPAL